MSEVSEQFGLFDDDKKYVIVFNMQSLISPIRHIVGLNSVAFEEKEFAAWYYESFNKCEGDEFLYCASSKDMREKKDEICKIFYELESQEERKAKWKAYCESNQKKDEVK